MNGVFELMLFFRHMRLKSDWQKELIKMILHLKYDAFPLIEIQPTKFLQNLFFFSEFYLIHKSLEKIYSIFLFSLCYHS